MRRLARHLFTSLVAFSLVSCVVVCVLWVRSYFVSDSIEYHVVRRSSKTPTELTVIANRGRVRVVGVQRQFSSPEGLAYYLRYHSREGLVLRMGGEPFVRDRADNEYLDRLGFRASWPCPSTKLVPGGRGSFTIRHAAVEFPFWLASLLFAGPLLHKMKLRRPRRPKPVGVCRACGYDLRATPGRCPECGTPAA